jgi:glycosyltransferase involved in cell wall biosynthesis
MKIAFVYDVVYPYVKGGAEKRIYELSLSLAKRGHEVHIFGMKYWLGPDVIEKEGVIYHGVCRPKKLYVNGRRSMFQALWFSVFLFFPLFKEKVDIIDCQAFPYFPVIPAWIVSRLRGGPLIVTWLEVWGNYWYEYLGFLGIFGKSLEKFASGLGDVRIAISGLTKKRLLNLAGRKDIEVVSGAIDAGFISSVKPSPEVSDIIAVGRLIKEKNFGLLIRAAALIQEKKPDFKVIIVGDGPSKTSLLTLSKECGTDANIKFYSFMNSYESLIALMKSSKVFASPSLREGFGISALEAMACGLSLATVQGDMNAVADMVLESGCGIVSGNDPELFSCAILNAYENFGDMKTAGLVFSGKYNQENLCGLYEEILRRG